jgi:hypothetical protein
MNADVFAEWMRRQGYRVVRTPSSYWYEASSRVYQAFPFHWVIDPPEEELLGMLRRNRAIALRYSAPVGTSKGKLSYHVVWEGSRYDLASLPRQARQNVRKGLTYATIERISLSRLATEGWLLRQDTLSRQGRIGAENRAWWQRLCLSAEGLPGFEAWGAIHNGELEASLLTLTCGDWCLFPYQQSATASLKHRVNNSLFYTATDAALERSGVANVFLGLNSLDAPESVDEFKFRMGYAAKPVRQRVVFHPWLAPFVNRASHAFVKRLLGRYPDHAALPKIEGMVRFYLEGNRPLQDQDCPACLAGCREEQLEEVL